jgi:hypothetical protein
MDACAGCPWTCPTPFGYANTLLFLPGAFGTSRSVRSIDPSLGVFIVAQGLFMYLEPERVRRLLSDIADRFPGAEMVFDVVPRWFSRLTLWGLNQTPHYLLPRMPWGINRDEVEETLRHWHPSLSEVKLLNYRPPRGLPFLVAQMMQDIPVLRHKVPGLVQVSVAPTANRNSDQIGSRR